MNNIIAYFYNINNIDIHKEKDNYYFYCNNHKYILVSLVKDERKLMQIYSILKYNNYNNYYHEIILNKFSNIITEFDNKKYVLLKSKNINTTIEDLIIQNNQYVSSYFIKTKDWVTLWEMKIDYIEYQLIHIKNKYRILYDSIDYYISLGECAISYLVNNKVDNLDSYISHERINSSINDYLNPLNLIIDYKSRDIAEYLKMIFYNYEDYILKCDYILERIKLQYNEYILLLGRLIYPSIYFDIYERIVSDEIKEKEIIKIISLNDKYLEYLKYIYNRIKSKVNIPSIDWL